MQTARGAVLKVSDPPLRQDSTGRTMNQANSTSRPAKLPKERKTICSIIAMVHKPCRCLCRNTFSPVLVDLYGVPGPTPAAYNLQHLRMVCTAVTAGCKR